MPRTFFLVLVVQFISTLADSAFLIVAIARTKELSGAEWLVPVLKIGFTLFYVVLAPFVGPLADFIRKGHVMLLANIFKVVAMLFFLCGFHPLLVIGIAGLGAAMYAPAKYGLITELLPPRKLVLANGYFEGATVCAVIFGTVLGGVFVSPMLTGEPIFSPPPWRGEAATQLMIGMLILLTLNLLATILSLGVADSGARYVGHSIHPLRLVRRFYQENRKLWGDVQGGISMSVTTLLWGVGATLQLIVLRWASECLGLPLAQAAYLQGITALGVIAGALTASRSVSLLHAPRLLPLGVAIGCMIPLLLLVHTVLWASILLVLVGAFAGFFVVPMNALLQHRGCTLLTAGRSIAVQGFNENAGMLAMLCVYALAIAVEIPLSTLIVGFGVIIAGPMTALYLVSRKALHL